MKYMQKQGFRRNPCKSRLAGQTLNGEMVYSSLSDIPDTVDMVDVFGVQKNARKLAAQAAAIGAKTLWLQIGIKSPDAQQTAAAHQMQFIQDRCPKIEHSKLSGLLGLGGFYSGLISARRAP